MSNIRIKDIATTAASTASDDFIAIDGATNGTRKLDIYNPTIGGNATISGGTITGGATGLSLASGGTNQNITLTPSGTGSVVFPSGSGSSPSISFSGTSISGLFKSSATQIGIVINNQSLGTLWAPFSDTLRLASSSSNANLQLNPSGSIDLNAQGTNQNITLTPSGTGIVRIGAASGSLLLVGTSTNSSNGAIQLATHTTSAGGIGFGTDTSLFRSSAGVVQVYGTSANAVLSLTHASTTAGKGFDIQIDGSKDAYVWLRENRNLYIGTNNTTALTLDSSQRCILSGALRLNNAYVAGAPAATGYVTIQDSAGTTYKVLVST